MYEIQGVLCLQVFEANPLRRDWRLDCPANHFSRGLDDSTIGAARLKPIQQTGKVGWGDRIDITVVANMVEYQLDPAASRLLSLGNPPFDGSHTRTVLDAGHSPRGIWIMRRNRIRSLRHCPAAIVATVF